MSYVYNYGEQEMGEMPITYSSSSSSTTGSGSYFENYFVGADTGVTPDNDAIGYAVSGVTNDYWQWVNVNIGGDWQGILNNNETLKFYTLMEDYASTDNGVEWKLPTPFSWFDILDIED